MDVAQRATEGFLWAGRRYVTNINRDVLLYLLIDFMVLQYYNIY